MAEKDDVKKTQIEEKQQKSAEPSTADTVPLGKEHWGKGGTYRKDENGKRIKVAQPKEQI